MRARDDTARLSHSNNIISCPIKTESLSSTSDLDVDMNPFSGAPILPALSASFCTHSATVAVIVSKERGHDAVSGVHRRRQRSTLRQVMFLRTPPCSLYNRPYYAAIASRKRGYCTACSRHSPLLSSGAMMCNRRNKQVIRT